MMNLKELRAEIKRLKRLNDRSCKDRLDSLINELIKREHPSFHDEYVLEPVTSWGGGL